MTSGSEPSLEDDGSGSDRYVLRLFVTGTTPRSTRAIENLRQICESELAGQYKLEVIDIYLHPEAASANQVVAAPTLLKLLPTPVRRIVGDLADRGRVLKGLEITREHVSVDDVFASFGGNAETEG